MMTEEQERARAEKGIQLARKALRTPHMINDDAAADHWAIRLVFWLDELKAINCRE